MAAIATGIVAGVLDALASIEGSTGLLLGALDVGASFESALGGTTGIFGVATGIGLGEFAFATGIIAGSRNGSHGDSPRDTSEEANFEGSEEHPRRNKKKRKNR